MKNKSFIQGLLYFYRPYLGRFIISWSVISAFTVLMMVFPYSLGKIIDHAINQNFNSIYNWIYLSLASLFLGKVVLLYFGQIYEIKKLDFAIENYLKRRSLEQLNKLSVGQHQNQNSGLKQDIVISGCDSLQQLSSMLINNLSFLVLQVVVGLIVIFFYNPMLTVIVGSSITVYVFLSIFLYKFNVSKLDEMVNRRNNSRKKYTDYIRNITLLLLNASEKSGMEVYNKSRKEYEETAKNYWCRYVGFMRIGDFVEIVTMGIVLFYCINLFSKGKITAGQIAIYMFWSRMVSGSLGNFNNIYRRLIELSINIKKFFQFLDIKPEIKPPQEEIELNDFKGGVEFKKVCFSYPVWDYFDKFDTDKKKNCKKVTRTVVEDISFTILPKEKIAFVGMSGAGKSTLVSLLMRAYVPQSGKILIDGIDYDHIDPEKLRKQVGLVEQDIQLMDDTLRSNLLVGLNGNSKNVTDDDLWRVMKIANITRFKGRLIDGLDTDIGEKGVKLSGGEKQRVAIARALLKEVPLVIFDEATSSLDGINEHEIHEAMFKAGENATCIFIAHRLATVKNVDRIIVLDEGRIVAEGKHEKLLEKCEIYKKLVKRQIVAF